MREDALYYAEREQQERERALAAGNPRVRQIHDLLASKYSQLVQRELMKLRQLGNSVH